MIRDGDRGRAASIIVVGAINVDMVVSAPALPKAGETVVGLGPARHGGGKGANAAVAAARSGAAVHLVGAVGDDELAEIALADLRQAGADVSAVQRRADAPTGVALIVVDGRGENQIAVGAGANAALEGAWVAERMEIAMRQGVGCVLVSTEIPPAAVAAAVRAAATSGVPYILNTAPPIPVVVELLDLRPVLTPNARELDQLSRMLCQGPADASGSGAGSSLAGAEAHATALARRTRRPVVVTLGAAGALIATPDGLLNAIPAPPAAVVDTTGAGDTFSGILAARIAAGDELSDAVRAAVVAGAISVGGVGARGGMPWAAELEAALGGEPPLSVRREPVVR